MFCEALPTWCTTSVVVTTAAHVRGAKLCGAVRGLSLIGQRGGLHAALEDALDRAIPSRPDRDCPLASLLEAAGAKRLLRRRRPSAER